jgi:hypothetical protein
MTRRETNALHRHGFAGPAIDLKVADKKVLSGIRAGKTVTFCLTKEAKSGYVISHIEPEK